MRQHPQKTIELRIFACRKMSTSKPYLEIEECLAAAEPKSLGEDAPACSSSPASPPPRRRGHTAAEDADLDVHTIVGADDLVGDVDSWGAHRIEPFSKTMV